jgi:hypothetical protein
MAQAAGHRVFEDPAAQINFAIQNIHFAFIFTNRGVSKRIPRPSGLARIPLFGSVLPVRIDR